MRRFGFVVKVRPEKLEYYKYLHANPWQSINRKINECNIRNYSIFSRDDLLFGYYEYIGQDYDADMRAMAEDPETRRWWAETDPCQVAIETANVGELWVEMEEVFHLD